MEEKLGYLIAKVEELAADTKSTAQKLEALEKRVDEKFKTAEATFRVLRWIGYIAVTALTVPWEELKQFAMKFLKWLS